MTVNVTVGRYSFPHEAHIARARLEAEGITAVVADEHTVNMNWLYSDALGGVRVQVSAEDSAAARQLLVEDRSAEVDQEFGAEEMRCPACDSNRVALHTRGRRSVFAVFLLLGFPLFFYRHGFRCERCEHFWQTE